MSRRLLSGMPCRCLRYCARVTTVTSHCTISGKIPFHESHKDYSTRARTHARTHTHTSCYTFHPVCLATKQRGVGFHHAIIRGEMRGVYRVLVGKCEGKRPLGRPWCRWEDNIKLDLQKVGWGERTGLMWITLRTGGGHW